MHFHEKEICFVYIERIAYLDTINLKRIITIDNYFHLVIGSNIAYQKHACGIQLYSPLTKIKNKQS